MKSSKAIIKIGVLTSVLAALFGGPCQAQESSFYNISFVALGERSDAEWTGDKIDMKVNAKNLEGVYPDRVYVANSQSKLKKNSSRAPQPLNLSLNVASPRVRFIEPRCMLLKGYGKEKKLKIKNFVTTPLPEKKGDYTVFLAQNAESKKWDEPQSLVLADASDQFPPASVRIINLSSLPIIVQQGSELSEPLAPGKSIVINNVLKQKNPERVTVWYEVKGGKRPAFRRALMYPSSQRLNITCTNSSKASRPIGAHLFVTPLDSTKDK